MCFGFLVAILLIFVICFSFFPFSGKKPSRKKNDKDEIETQWEKEGKKNKRKCEKDFPEREGSGGGFLSFSFPTQVEWIQKKSRRKGKSSFYTTG